VLKARAADMTGGEEMDCGMGSLRSWLYCGVEGWQAQFLPGLALLAAWGRVHLSHDAFRQQRCVHKSTASVLRMYSLSVYSFQPVNSLAVPDLEAAAFVYLPPSLTVDARAMRITPQETTLMPMGHLPYRKITLRRLPSSLVEEVGFTEFNTTTRKVCTRCLSPFFDLQTPHIHRSVLTLCIWSPELSNKVSWFPVSSKSMLHEVF